MAKRRKKKGVPGVSFSWKRATGVTKMKRKVSRVTGVPFTKAARQRKVGKALTGGGCLMNVVMMILFCSLLMIFLAACEKPIETTQSNPDEIVSTPGTITTTPQSTTTTPQSTTTTPPSTTTVITAATTNPNDIMVWIPGSGSRYHSRSDCSNMNNPSFVTRSEAINAGFNACARCW
ncbi:MAG: hypothetical protein LBC82_01395 [Oscillospiraceae bacterium]|jgi:hypothetical protein|nr:hypothetical protein [Oscillospiraceae bacterium]